MEIKFFHKDVIGKKPTKVGDFFKVHFLGKTCLMQVKSMHEWGYMAVTA